MAKAHRHKADLFVLFGILFVLGCVSSISFANLGDNELKTAEKFGQPVNEQKASDSLTVREYRFHALAVEVTFLNGTSQCEKYKRLDGKPLGDDQIQALLGDNANSLSWKPQASSGGSLREWVITGVVAESSSSRSPVVLAVSPRHVSSEGTRMVAVDAMNTGESSGLAPSTPPVLRRAVYHGSETNAALSVFTAAYEQVIKRERKPATTDPKP